MILRNLSKDEIKQLSASLAPKLVKHPLFVYFNPRERNRSGFIETYLNYHIYHYSKYNALLTNEEKTVLISLKNPNYFTYKYSGKFSRRMKKFKNSSSVFYHRESLEFLLDLISAPSIKKMFMTVYAAPENLEDVDSLIDEAIELAKENHFMLIYETFSPKLIPMMRDKGFNVAYQRGFDNSRFIQTAMVYYKG